MEGLWHTLADPLRFAFMQRALLVAVAIGVLCAVVGSYLLVQSLALLGDALSHSLLPGLAIAYLLDLNLFVGAFVAGLLSALLIQWIRSATPSSPMRPWGSSFLLFCPRDPLNHVNPTAGPHRSQPLPLRQPPGGERR